jgi:hypothetical protein
VTNPEPNAAREEHSLSRRSSLLGLGVVAVAFVLAAALSWRKWPDVLVDFGTQLYIPWRILNGAVLYRDLFYFAGGPLSQYFNALLFKIFGVSFSTLIFANLLLTAAMIFVIYRRFLAAADAWTATLIGVGVVFVFAFAEFTPYGNYNYITPYSEEAFHGLVLSVFAIALLCDWVNKGKILAVIAAGFCAGLVFLTKPDIFTALTVAVITAFVLFAQKHGRRRCVRALTAFVCAAIIPSLGFLIYFAGMEDARESLRSVVFGWLPLLHGTVAKSPFYIWCTGLDHPLSHLMSIIIYFLAVVVVVAVYAFAFRWLKKLSWLKLQYAPLIILIAPLLIWAGRFDWINCGWPLPLLCLSACILILCNYKKLEQAPVFPLLWSVFALALLAKLGLLPRIWHYGFALAMPAFVSSIYLLFWLLPNLLEKRFSVPAVQLRMMVGLVLVIGLRNLFDFSQAFYDRKTLALGDGGDQIITYNTYDTGQGIKSQAEYAALLWTEKYVPPGATLAVLPQGILLNYLTRHVNPSGGLDWNPTMFTVFGQNHMTEVFEKNPPDYIYIVEWSASDFGVGYFGSSPDYGQALMQWIGKNYQQQLLIGNEPLTDGRFGIKILKRLPASQTQSGGFNAAKSLSSSADKKFTPTSNDASVQPKPSGVM